MFPLFPVIKNSLEYFCLLFNKVFCLRFCYFALCLLSYLSYLSWLLYFVVLLFIVKIPQNIFASSIYWLLFFFLKVVSLFSFFVHPLWILFLYFLSLFANSSFSSLLNNSPHPTLRWLYVFLNNILAPSFFLETLFRTFFSEKLCREKNLAHFTHPSNKIEIKSKEEE